MSRNGSQAHLCVLGKVQHHRTGPAGAGDVEGTGHGPGHLVGGADLVVPFADGGGKADDVGLLERVGTQGGGRNLTGNHHYGGGIRHGVGHSGNDIGGSGARGYDDDAGLSAYAGKTLGRVDGPLFVADQNVMDGVLVVHQFVIHRHNLAAGIAEDRIDPFFLKGAPEGFGACYGILIVHLTAQILRMAPSSAELTEAA